MNVVITLSPRECDAPPISLCVDGKVCKFASGTTRVFRLYEGTTDGASVSTETFPDAGISYEKLSTRSRVPTCQARRETSCLKTNRMESWDTARG